MKHYIDNRGGVRAFDDAVSQEAIDRIASKRGVTLTPISEADYAAIINPPPTLEQAVSAKVAELSAAYASEITGDVEYGGIIYQGDQRSLDALLSRLRIGADPSHWRAKDNSNTVPFTLTDVEALRSMIEFRAATATEKLHSRKDAVLGIIAQVQAEKSEAGTGITEADGIVAVQEIVW